MKDKKFFSFIGLEYLKNFVECIQLFINTILLIFNDIIVIISMNTTLKV